MANEKNASRYLIEDIYEGLEKYENPDTVLRTPALFIDTVKAYRAAIKAGILIPPENTPCGKTPDEWILDQGKRLNINPEELA